MARTAPRTSFLQQLSHPQRDAVHHTATFALHRKLNCESGISCGTNAMHLNYMQHNLSVVWYRKRIYLLTFYLLTSTSYRLISPELLGQLWTISLSLELHILSLTPPVAFATMDPSGLTIFGRKLVGQLCDGLHQLPLFLII